MPPSSRMDPSHNPVQQGLNNPNLTSQPGQQLHHRNPPPPQSRQPIGQTGSGSQAHGGDLSFNPGPGMVGQPGMSGATEGSEPSLDVSSMTILSQANFLICISSYIRSLATGNKAILTKLLELKRPCSGAVASNEDLKSQD